MNSKCRKSNLVAHWYILLFAYLPAPVVSSCVSGLGTSNTQRYAYIFLLFFYNCVSFSPHLAFLCLLLTPVHRFPSSICLSPPFPFPFPSTPLPHSSFSLCLPQTSGCISPPAGCMTGEQVERRANDKSLSSSLPASLSLSLSLSLSISPTVLPEALLSLPSSLFPPSTFPSYLTTLIFKSAQAAFHLLSPWRSRQNHQGWKKVG